MLMNCIALMWESRSMMTELRTDGGLSSFSEQLKKMLLLFSDHVFPKPLMKDSSEIWFITSSKREVAHHNLPMRREL